MRTARKGIIPIPEVMASTATVIPGVTRGTIPATIPGTGERTKRVNRRKHVPARDRDEDAVNRLGPLFGPGTKPVELEELQLGDMFDDGETKPERKRKKKAPHRPRKAGD